MKILKKYLFVWLILAVVLVVMLLQPWKQGDSKQPLRAPSETTAPATVSIETVYGPLEFPAALFENLRHMEVTEDAVAMEVFYMLGTGGEREVFRIYYADEQVGTNLGYLTTESGEISVNYSICEYTDEDFADEAEKKLYYSMMDAFTTVTNSIYTDERFSEERTVEPLGSKEVNLRYWKVTLPENVMYEETTEGDTYRVDFYGEVSGERIELYFIALGNAEADTNLGLYTVDDAQKPVMVKSYSMTEYEGWPKEDQAVIYQMMESLNGIIQTIVVDENFSVPESAT